MTPNGIFRGTRTYRNIGIGKNGDEPIYNYNGDMITRTSAHDPVITEYDTIIGERLRKNLIFLYIDVFSHLNGDSKLIQALLQTMGFPLAGIEIEERKKEERERNARKKRRRVYKSAEAFEPLISRFVSNIESDNKRSKLILKQREKVREKIRKRIIENMGVDVLNDLDNAEKKIRLNRQRVIEDIKRLSDLAESREHNFVDREILRDNDIQVVVSPYYGYIKAYTDDVWVKPRSDSPEYIGRYEITIPFNTGNPAYIEDPKNINVNNELITGARKNQHYHIDVGGNVCWGNSEKEVERLLKRGDYTSVILVIKSLLQIINEGNWFVNDLDLLPDEEAVKKYEEKYGKKYKGDVR
jgi:hypothetical protein